MSTKEPSPSSQNKTVIKAVAATAASSLLIAGIFFYVFYRCVMTRQRQRNKFSTSFCRGEAMETHHELVIVDDNGLNVLYLSKPKVLFHQDEEEKRIDSRGDKPETYEPIHEIPLLHSPSYAVDYATEAVPYHPQKSKMPPLDPRPASPESPLDIAIEKTPPPSPPPPPPPPPPPTPSKEIPKTPLPPISAKRNYVPPPPPIRAGGLVSSLKPPPPPRGKDGTNSRTENLTLVTHKGNDEVQLKMKPLHWDKVVSNADHSLIWDDINGGSLPFDDRLLEALFGYDAATNQNSERRNALSSSGNSNAQPAQIFILEPRKSQNIAIVLKSLAISRKQILDALIEGQGLNIDTLEKLTKISPTQEETAKILQFNGNQTKLADAESFLYHILKAVPSAFIRINAMLFKSNYDPEILHLKESVQNIERACKELRTPGIFLKLLEAILKAGNRMNAGTARGNAQGFNLTALQKISNVKSTDGKTTLLHFVVEQVVQSEGKRGVINRKHDLGRSNSQSSHSDSLTAIGEMEKEYILVGLPVLGGLIAEFSNVKKAATIDYDSFINMCSTLTGRVTEIRQLVERCGNTERCDRFVREMKGFLEECEEELNVVREEQIRVMELVKRTTEYYQAGIFKDKAAQSLQIFVIVKDFLAMVDQVCTDITKNLQKKNVTGLVSPPPVSPPTTTLAKFQNLQSYFMPKKAATSSSSSFSESEDDF